MSGVGVVECAGVLQEPHPFVDVVSRFALKDKDTIFVVMVRMGRTVEFELQALCDQRATRLLFGCDGA